MVNRTAAKPDDSNVASSYARPSTLFHSTRQILWFSLFALYFCVDVAELGLVAQQIHKHTWGDNTDWPGVEAGHGMGLLLFATLFGLLISIFHWALSMKMFLIIFVASGVFFGTGAGIIFQTPFGEGLKCGMPVDTFPAAYQPFYGDCSRWTAIEGLAWVLFALSVIGFFFAFFDQTEFSFVRSDIYDVDVEAQETKQGHH